MSTVNWPVDGIILNRPSGGVGLDGVAPDVLRRTYDNVLIFTFALSSSNVLWRTTVEGGTETTPAGLHVILMLSKDAKSLVAAVVVASVVSSDNSLLSQVDGHNTIRINLVLTLEVIVTVVVPLFCDTILGLPLYGSIAANQALVPSLKYSIEY